MSDEQWISIAEFRVARAPTIMTAYGLGSCLAIVLYDPATRLGGLAHALLPAASSDPTIKPGKYVDSAIHAMLAQMEDLGAQRQQIVACLFGGAQMFQPVPANAGESIGQRNVRAAEMSLHALRILLVGKEVGGNSGRTVVFDLSDGSVMVRSLLQDGKLNRFSLSNQEVP